jgi:hypothetical protein
MPRREALWAGGQRGEKKKRKMTHSITRRAIKDIKEEIFFKKE